MNRAIPMTLLVVGLGLSLTACTVSMAGGMAGGILTMVFCSVLALGLSTTQSGCAPDIGTSACLSQVADPDVGPCLTQPPPDTIQADAVDVTDSPDFGDVACLTDVGSEPDLGVCLSQLPPDAGPGLGEDIVPEMEEDIVMGPCLQPSQEDVEEMEDDISVGPCLEPPAPDVEDSDANEPDVIESDAMEKEEDVELMPCLSPPQPDPESEFPEGADLPEAEAADADDRSAVQDRLMAQGVLPPAVVARLLAARKDKAS